MVNLTVLTAAEHRAINVLIKTPHAANCMGRHSMIDACDCDRPERAVIAVAAMLCTSPASTDPIGSAS